MVPTTRRGQNTLTSNTNPNNMTPESVQAMIDQALQQNSTNGDASHSSHGDDRRNVQTTPPCFYADFMKCQPLNFKGTEGVVGLTRWIEKMESVFNISGCAIENQVKFTTCTMLGVALTWWNGQIRTLGLEAYSMPWEVLKKKMTDKYCSQGEIKKLEIELWNLKVKGNDVPTYTERFQELTLICTKFVANETEKVDKYINGLPDNIYGNVKSARPKTLDETIELANDLMDQKLCTYAERMSPRSTIWGRVKRSQGQWGKSQGLDGCFECEALGNFKRDCPKLKNKDGGNGSAQRWVYAVGNAEKKGNASMDPDSNVVTSTFLLKNHYAAILFDTGADRSFISTAFSSQINIAPTPLENSYDVELADGKLVGIDTIIRVVHALGKKSYLHFVMFCSVALFTGKRSLSMSGKTYNPPVNPNTKTAIYLDDSEDEAEEVEKEAEPLPKKPTQTDKPPLESYKQKIPYPQCLNKEKMEARYAKILDMIKEGRINVPLVDVLAGMPNYWKFLKDLVSNKSKMEQIFVAFLTAECSIILQNKIPPKLGDLESFLIPCKLANSVEYLALADLGASINLMSYSLYAALSGTTLKPTKMSIRLANHTYQYPMGVAENMLVQVGKFVFPVDFVILQMEEDDRVPLILRRPFLHTANAIIRVKNKELNLGIREDRATFHIDKAMQHSHMNDDTCFCLDVVDEIIEDELDALLDDSKTFLNT
ncbi:putative reverse transcriptase domain-containing protein [Tanacetum coccineum]